MSATATATATTEKPAAAARQSVQLHETIVFEVASTGKVDREARVIRDAKIIGFESKNNRSYSPSALQKAVGLYEGARVNANHPTPANARSPRDVIDRLGQFRNVKFVPEAGVYGDFHYLKAHPLAEAICESAERGLGTFGFSHNAEGKTTTKNGRTVVEAIERVLSVDLVADPATTNGLFEAEQPPAVTETLADVATSVRWAFENEASAIFCDPKTTPEQKKKRLAALVDKHEAAQAAIAPSEMESHDMATATPAPITEGQSAAAPATGAAAATESAAVLEAAKVAALAASAQPEQGQPAPVAPATPAATITEGKPAAPADAVPRDELFEAIGLFGTHKITVEADLLEDCLAMPRARRAAFVERLGKYRVPADAAQAQPAKTPPAPIFGARSQGQESQPVQEGGQGGSGKAQAFDATNVLQVQGALRGLNS